MLFNRGNGASCVTTGSDVPNVRVGISSTFDAEVVFVILGVRFLVGGFLLDEFPLLSLIHL